MREFAILFTENLLKQLQKNTWVEKVYLSNRLQCGHQKDKKHVQCLLTFKQSHKYVPS